MPVRFPNNSPSIYNNPALRPGGTLTPTNGNRTTTTPSPTTNTFEIGASNTAGLSPAVRARTEASVATFENKLKSILHHDAASLAEGHTPIRAGDPLSESSKKELQDATKDLFMDLPLGSLSPKATAGLKTYLDGQGISSDNLETKTLKDLGSVGGDLAKKWSEDLKDASPATYYGILGTAGAAVGAYGYLEGSQALKKLGIKPEFKTELFNDKVKIRAEAMWDKKFKNFNATADLDTGVRWNATSLRFRSHLDARNIENSDGKLDLRLGRDNLYAEGSVTANATDGVTGYGLNAHYNNDNFSINGNATFNESFDLQGANINGRVDFGSNASSTFDLKFDERFKPSEAGLTARISGDNFNVSGSARHNFIEDRTSLNISAGYTPTENLEFAIKGSHDSRGESRIGLGVTWNF